MLDWVEYAHNSLSSASTRVSPFQGALSFQPPLFEAQEEEAESPSVRAFIRRCRHTWRAVRRRLHMSQAFQAVAANAHQITAPVYKVGELVWLSFKDLPIKGGGGKLAPRFLGPFRVDRVICPVAVCLRISAFTPRSTFPELSQWSPAPCRRQYQRPLFPGGSTAARPTP